MNFSQALDSLKAGNTLTRTKWNPSSMWVALQKPDEKSKMTAPYLYIWTPEQEFRDGLWFGSKLPWVPTQRDLLAEDWELIVI